jgi:DNA repair protein RAD16
MITAEAATPSTTSRPRRGKAAAVSSTPLAIANTSDLDDDEDDLIAVAPSTVQRRIVEAVVIPVIRRSASGKVTIDSASNSSVEAASIANTFMESSPDYETPATTPGDFRTASTASKRKRSALYQSAIESDTETSPNADEALAIQLQEEEYDYFQGGSSKRARVIVDDSDDLDSVLSEPLSVDSVVPAKRQRPKKQQPIATSAELPATGGSKIGRRTPRRSIRSTTSVATPTAIADFEEIGDSELSELEELSEFEDDEASVIATDDEEFEDNDTEAAEPSAAPQAEQDQAQTTSRRRRRGRQSNNPRNGNSTEARRARFRERMQNMRLSRRDRERQKLEKAHPEIKTMWKELEKIPVLKPEPIAQPVSINRQLKSYQLEGVAWMIAQEKSGYKGGLLGDEMGMGKTIQAVSLIMSDWPQRQPTLVVVPPVALMQWSAEITEYTDGKLKVLVYHGQNSKVKNMSLKDLKKFDVIMISYNSLESLYRKETKGWSRGEDIVKEDSLIHAMHFHRLILDEAHSIKSRTTGVAKACFALKGSYKWCLSGTPVQNRIGEFFSLLRFLEVRPFADYFCKRCPCSILHWELDDDHMCKGCKHSGIEHVSVFNQELLNPLTQSEEIADRHKAMERLYLITARIMLRRMKRDYVSSMELPMKEVVVHNEFFGEIERDFSSSIMSNTARQFDTYVSRGVMLNNYANIFGLIMQMRQVANHPDLLLKKHAAQGQNVLVCNICDEVAEEAIRSKCKHDFCRACVKSYVQSVEENDGEADCPRCHIPLSIDFDQPDIEQDEEVVKKSSIINRIDMKNWTSSTKIEMLIYDLWKLRSKKQTLKSIVFSQFTSMLQLIEWRLRRAGFSTVMLDGSMTPIQRQRSIEHFMTNPDVEIFLVSLKAGGVALNLTEASRVFIVDPWWNPAAEWQSADRCHRIGQKRPCVITRLCIEDSVESRMVQLQEKKANMINGTINNDKTSMEKLTPEDMEFLFRGT